LRVVRIPIYELPSLRCGFYEVFSDKTIWNFLIVFVNAIAIIAVFVLENEPSIWSRYTALVFIFPL